MMPNGSLNATPPANGCPPGALWQAAQSAARDRYSPRAIKSGDDGLSGAETSGARSNKSQIPVPAIMTAHITPTTPTILNHVSLNALITTPLRWFRRTLFDCVRRHHLHAPGNFRASRIQRGFPALGYKRILP